VRRLNFSGSEQLGGSVIRQVARVAAWVLAVSSCVPLGMTLPYDDAPPAPNGHRIRTSVGWLTTEPSGVSATVAEGKVLLQPERINDRTVWQQVLHLQTDEGAVGDSILLDRNTLRPIATWHWTADGTYITRYNHRQVTREFRDRHGHDTKRVETLELEPYSARGVELVASALPLREGYTALIPVVFDTVPRGWSWMRITVLRELNVAERPDMPERDTWIVECDVENQRIRLWVAVDGRSVRRIEQLGPDGEVESTLRHMLLTVPDAARANGQ
jgi:hypothetical protein